MSPREPSLTVFSSLEPTYGVSQLCGEVRDFLAEAFASVWVVGEAQRVRPSARGHVYFELVEKGERDEAVDFLSRLTAGEKKAVEWAESIPLASANRATAAAVASPKGTPATKLCPPYRRVWRGSNFTRTNLTPTS